MKRFRRLALIGLIGLAAFLLFPPLAFAQQYKPGANFWGDYDNSLIDGPDVGALAASLAGMDPGYWTLAPTARNRTPLWQDLDGNGIADGPDLAILKAWAKGDFSDITGNPISLEAENYSPSIIAGDSVVIRARGESWNPGKYRPGYGIVYQIRDDLSSCHGATIYGRNVLDGDTYGYYADMAYEYTDEPGESGYAQTRVSAPPTCTVGQTIEIEVYLPADSEFGVNNRRHPARLTAPQNISITVVQSVSAIDIAPAGASIEEGDIIPFQAICTILDSSTIDCTDSYGGVNTLWSSTGDLNQLSPANFFQAGLDGAHGTVTVYYNDGVHSPVSDFASIIVQADSNSPETFIDSQPPNPDNSSSPSFAFSCDDVPCTFQCQMDSGGFSACSSPRNYSGLSESAHTFEVKATDFAGNPDLTPASYSWTIDLNPPDTQITNQPPALTKATSAIFEFACTEPPCTYECKLDSLGWSSCTSPQDYSNLAEGSHTFQVRAIDSALNVDSTPAAYTWTIDITPPETFLDSYPPNPSNSTTADFTFHCTGGPCAFECNLDSGGWSFCSAPKSYSGLLAGSHDFQVRATDAAGNLEPSPASYDWRIKDAFLAISTDNAPEPRIRHSAFWTGSEMIVWGGGFQTGGRYNPSSDSWTATSTQNAPSAGKSFHAAVWTGTEMIVWGGWDDNHINTGARYNPAADSWLPTSLANAPSPRYYHYSVWTGTEMVIWGGGGLTSGGRYNPATNSWIATSTVNAPAYRMVGSAVWTGTEMIVWGGWGSWPTTNTGGRYNPAGNSWIATPLTNAPQARAFHAAVWTGTEMIVWGGQFFDGDFHCLNTGGRYNPLTNSWTALSTLSAPGARYNHTAVWTGTEMIVWGGQVVARFFSDGGKYNPVSDTWTPISVAEPPLARTGQSAVWTGSEMIIWGGLTDQGQTSTGARYWP